MATIEYVGPFNEWRVVVDGWQVPFLSCIPLDGGKVDLDLDGRYGLILDVATAERVVPFLADAIAIALGFTCHPREDWVAPKTRYPMRRSRPLYTEGPSEGETAL